MYCRGVIIFVIVCYCGVQGDTFYSCDWLTSNSVDCSRFPDELFCGTNRITYNNKCYFSRAHCIDTSIDLLHQGACTSADKPTGAPSAGSDVVFDFFCTNLSHSGCPTDVKKVCASDNWTYLNYCEYEKAKCTHRELTIIGYGDCP